MKKCNINNNHWYANHLTECPWCKLAKSTGEDPFPDSSTIGQQVPLPGRASLSSYTSTSTPPEPIDYKTFNQFRSKILAVFTVIFGLLGLLFPETLGSYMLIVGAISIPIIIRKTTKTIVPALCFVIIAIINYFLTGISPILAGAFGGVLFSLFFGYYFSRPLFKYQNNLHENIINQLWLIAVVLLLINIVVVIPFEFDNKNIQETSTPTPLVSSIIHSEGQLRISQTWSADLDEGVVGGSMSDMDFWFVAETATKRYLSPSNGAKMAIVGTTSVGINGCKTAKLLQNRIDINDLSEGTYVCVLTNQGRYSEFRVDEPINPSPGALIITYTTWETANPQSQSADQKTITNSIGMEFVLIPAGEFKMGLQSGERSYRYDERPVHTVTIEKAYYLGKYEVTQKQWREVMGTNPSYSKGDNLPVETVSWNDVQEFVKKLNEKEGTDKYRLPSEAEWEYAARAGTTTRYSFGNDESDLGNYAWYLDNSGNWTHLVGQKQPNPWGLYDMYGNVWELVQDRYHSNYDGAPTDGSAWEDSSNSDRIFRGGCIFNFAWICQSVFRGVCDHGHRDPAIGFRLHKEV